jgi:hypothetical protein
MITANVVDSQFSIHSRIVLAPDPDIYFEKAYNPYPNLKFTGYVSNIRFCQPFNKYGGLMVSFLEPEVLSISEERAEILKRSGILVPVLAMVSCDKVGFFKG